MKLGGKLQLTELYPGWPHKYDIIGGLVLGGINEAYPRLIWNIYNDRVYIVPRSMMCAGSLPLLTKSQRNRRCCGAHLTSLEIGSLVSAIASSDADDYVVRAFVDHGNKDTILPSSGSCLDVTCVFSDETPQRCFIYEFWKTVSLHGPSLTHVPIPNVVYEGQVEWLLAEPSNNPFSQNSKIRVILRMASIFCIKERLGPGHLGYFNILKACPWNSERKMLEPSPIVDATYRTYQIDEDVSPSSLQPLPKLVHRKRTIAEPLWYFDPNRVIRVQFPKTVVKITRGLDTKTNKWNQKNLPDGHFINAIFTYNEFINAYYVEEYIVPAIGCNKLESRMVLKNGQYESEYLVRVRESCLFKGFYTCTPLQIVLIADSDRMLRNVDFERHPTGCPVWITLHPEHNRLAHFTISALAKQKEPQEFLPAEKMMSYPIISGYGILVDHNTGAVLSESHPQTAIRLMDVDKLRVPLGHFFYFQAVFWPKRQCYLAGNIQLISAERRQPMEVHCVGDKILFEATKIICFALQMGDVHFGWNIGPISDPMSLVSKKHGSDCKKLAHGHLSYNDNWSAGRDSQMILYSLETDMNMKRITSWTIGEAGLDRGWQQQNQTCGAKGECQCGRLWRQLCEKKEEEEQEQMSREDDDDENKKKKYAFYGEGNWEELEQIFSSEWKKSINL